MFSGHWAVLVPVQAGSTGLRLGKPHGRSSHGGREELAQACSCTAAGHLSICVAHHPAGSRQAAQQAAGKQRSRQQRSVQAAAQHLEISLIMLRTLLSASLQHTSASRVPAARARWQL